MEVHFTPEQETQLSQLASKAGTDAEQLVKETILRLIRDEISFRRPTPELPVWDLGAAFGLTYFTRSRADGHDDALRHLRGPLRIVFHRHQSAARSEAAPHGRRRSRHNRLTLFSSRPAHSRPRG